MATAPTPLFHEYLLAAAHRTPEAVALVGPRTSWSYAELATRVEAHAQVLGAAGLGKGDFAVLDFYPCPDAIALMLACSRRGIAFVNVSADTPPSRKNQVARRVAARLVLTQPGVGTGAPEAPITGSVSAAGALELRGELGPARAHEALDPEDLVYLIFTSGTTGEPKGIMMSHRGAVSALRGLERVEVKPSDRIGTVAPLQFDFAIVDLGMALGNGAALVQVPVLLLQQPAGFAAYLRDKQVTQMQGVPSLWRETLRSRSEALFAGSGLHSILYGAEAFSPAALRQLCKGAGLRRVINIFGPSEAMLCAFKQFDDVRGGEGIADIDGRVSFGSALLGVELLVLDGEGRPIREPRQLGELYFKGPCLFHGYYQDPVQTSARLVPDPTGASSERWYRSGDLVFFDEHGDFYFHSRIDNQVKVQGNRVELEEVDLRLAQHPAVIEAAAVFEPEPRPCIVAYVVLDPVPAEHERGAVFGELTRTCGQSLPRYMLPARYELVEALPRNSSGKVDRRALAERSSLPAPLPASSPRP